jgi:hypothetical protein
MSARNFTRNGPHIRASGIFGPQVKQRSHAGDDASFGCFEVAALTYVRLSANGRLSRDLGLGLRTSILATISGPFPAVYHHACGFVDCGAS